MKAAVINDLHGPGVLGVHMLDQAHCGEGVSHTEHVCSDVVNSTSSLGTWDSMLQSVEHTAVLGADKCGLDNGAHFLIYVGELVVKAPHKLPVCLA